MSDTLPLLNEPLNAKSLIRKKSSILAALKEKKLEKKFKIAILGGSSTEDIKTFLEIFLLNKGLQAEFYESDFNTYYEEIVFKQGGLYEFKPDIVFIHTTYRNIKTIPNIKDTISDVKSKADDFSSKLELMWNNLRENLNCTIIQNNLEFPPIRNFGSEDQINNKGLVKFITEINSYIYNYSANESSFYVNDINYLSAYYGLENWHDEKSWTIGKYAFNYILLPQFSYNLFSIIESIYGMKKKVLILDLDNTLWGGVIGDDGVENIKIGPDDAISESFYNFQKYIKHIQSTGVLLAICSKNEMENAMLGINHPNSLLKRDDFVCIKANWQQKSKNILEISKELNLGLNSFVFVDDNPAEREEVKSSLPDVSVPDIGTDVNEYIKIINSCNYFDRLSLTDEDSNRTDYYAKNEQRTTELKNFQDYDEYLASLEMKAFINEFDEKNFIRIHSLINKTNQFNLTTRRYTEAEVKDVISNKNKIGMYGFLKDKFGDNGLIVVLAGDLNLNDSVFDIQLWCMSCRVFKRQMEYYFFNEIIKKLRTLKIKKIIGTYIPSKKNKVVENIYEELGFLKLNDDMDKHRYELVIENYKINKTKIEEDNDR